MLLRIFEIAGPVTTYEWLAYIPYRLQRKILKILEKVDP